MDPIKKYYDWLHPPDDNIDNGGNKGWSGQQEEKEEAFSVWPGDHIALAGPLSRDPTVKKKVACLIFPPYARLASIYAHFVDPPQTEEANSNNNNDHHDSGGGGGGGASYDHTLSHDVMFSVGLAKALRLTGAEMRHPGFVKIAKGKNPKGSSFLCYAGYEEFLCCPYHWHHTAVVPWMQGIVCEPIGAHADWFLMFKVFPEIFGITAEGSTTTVDVVVRNMIHEDIVTAICKFACQSGEVRMVKFLLGLKREYSHHQGGGRGGPPQIISVRPGADGQKLILFAFDNADDEILKLLLQHQEEYDAYHGLIIAKAGEVNSNPPTARQGMLCSNWDPFTERRPLHFAAMHGRAKGVKMLLEAGANASPVSEVLDKYNYAPIHYAFHNADVEVLSVLLAQSTPCPEKCSVVSLDHSGNIEITLLQLAAKFGRVNAINTLIAAGCIVNTTSDTDNKTALHYAALLYSQPAAVEALLDHGASIDVRDAEGDTPLESARRAGHSECVALLEKAAAV